MSRFHLSRRSFLKSSLAASAAALVNPHLSLGQDSRMHVPLDAVPHARTWMAFPDSVEIWGRQLLPGVQQDIARIAGNIAEFEPVFMIANRQSVAKARSMVASGVTVIAMPLNDCWTRDTGPVFRVNCSGAVDCIGLNFNGWGGKQVHSYDALVARNITAYLGLPFTAAPFVSEGGAIETDGAGTLMANASSIVNSNRNPNLTEAQITAYMCEMYGASQVIWFSGIKNQDETDDHVDGTSRFLARPKTLVEAPYPGDNSIWARDQDNQASVLDSSTDAEGMAIQVTRLGDPDYDLLPSVKDEYAGYANYYVCNGAIMVIKNDQPTDAAAKSVLESMFPGRTVVQVGIPNLSQGGGGIHCVTQPQPAPLWGA